MILQQIRKASSPKVSARALRNIRWVIIGATAIFLLVITLQISLMGKNLTYASRFTPSSNEKDILNSTYYIEVQILLIFFLTLHVFSVCGLGYITMNRGLKAFMISSLINVSQNVMIVIFCLYFVGGGSQYKNFLSQLDQSIKNTPGYCDENICHVSACIRIYTYKMAKNMTISFLVIGQLCFASLLPLSFIFNRGKKNMNTLEMLV